MIITEDPSLSEREFRVTGLCDIELSFISTDPVCPALAVWIQREKFTFAKDGSLSAKVPPGCRYSFQFLVALFLAEMLFKIRNPDYEASKQLNELKDQKSYIRKGGFPDTQKLGYGLAQLASYAQRKWTGAYIACPVEQQISSIYLAALRVCGDTDAERCRRIDTLFKYIVRILYPLSDKDREHVALEIQNLHVSRITPACPMLEGVLEGAKFTGEYWIESLFERLKHDKEAYELDICRAQKEYAALDKAGGGAPIEMVRISVPESLLFDLWAWQDCCNSKEKRGFPLVWIDGGWGRKGFELRLNPAARTDLAPLGLHRELKDLGGTPEDDNWSLHFPDKINPSDVRYLLKKKLFPDGAVFKFERFECKVPELGSTSECGLGAQPLQPRTVCLEKAIRDSEVDLDATLPKEKQFDQEGHYCWAEITYSKDVDIYKTWAGDEIACILYSLLRTDPKMRLPNGFLKEHVHRQPGLVSVWTREGMVVAYQEGHAIGEKAALDLRCALKRAAELEGLLKKRIDSDGKTVDNLEDSPSESCADEEDDLINLHLELRHEAAQPRFLPIRQFLERLHAQEVYDALRQKDADQGQLKTLCSMEQADKKLAWLELFIFAVYITEAAQILGDIFQSPYLRFFSIIGFAIVGLGFAYMFMNPGSNGEHKNNNEKRTFTTWVRRRQFLVAIILSIVTASGLTTLLQFKFKPPSEIRFGFLGVWGFSIAVATLIPFIFSRNPPRFWHFVRKDWEILGQLGLISAVVVLYAGHFTVGLQVVRSNTEPRDTEAVLQSIEQSINNFAAGEQASGRTNSTSEMKELDQISDSLKQLDADLKAIEAQGHKIPAPKAAAQPGARQK
jgi:hypothetical protein